MIASAIFLGIAALVAAVACALLIRDAHQAWKCCDSERQTVLWLKQDLAEAEHDRDTWKEQAEFWRRNYHRLADEIRGLINEDNPQ